MVALMVIAAAAVLPTVEFQIKRDREQELIHRGVQYSRAIRAYYKKFGRYPTRLEELENTNNLRFLRKRYKDPITQKDFKLLHFGEVRLTLGGIVPAPGVNPGAINNTGFAPQPGLNPPPAAFGASPAPNGTPQPVETPDANAGPQGDSGQQQVQQSGIVSKEESSPNQQVFGGGPIVGVISTSKKQGIREFNHKKKYSEWQFIYDPATDRGGLLSTPNQPPLLNGGGQVGQPLQQGNPSSPFGSSSPGNNPSPNPNPVQNGPGASPPPPTTPEQQ